VEGTRYLVVTADDFGIGPATSRGILELAAAGRVTGTVLLVSSPHAEAAVHSWRQAGCPLDLGWHPCLTLDRPILPPEQVPSLVTGDGRFPGLGLFSRRWLFGRINVGEVEAELQAQYQRFIALVGRPPSIVNSHHHIQIFGPVGKALRNVLAACAPAPYLRRVREPWLTLRHVPGARAKRMFLSLLGRRDTRGEVPDRLPGNDWLVGITDPPYVHDPRFLARWLTHVPGRVVELTCHPGHHDETLVGRDCTRDDGMLERRVREMDLLLQPTFVDAYQHAGFTLISPAELARREASERRHAA
jgi:chitin disaccharide deacetylase